MAFYKNPEPVAPEYIVRARQLGAALLADGMKTLGGIENDGAMQADTNPVVPGMSVVGTALTVDTANGDNFPIPCGHIYGRYGLCYGD